MHDIVQYINSHPFVMGVEGSLRTILTNLYNLFIKACITEAELQTKIQVTINAHDQKAYELAGLKGQFQSLLYKAM